MNWCGYSEKEVWELTPRKWNDLVSIHVDIQRQKYGQPSERRPRDEQVTGFIDQIGWG